MHGGNPFTNTQVLICPWQDSQHSLTLLHKDFPTAIRKHLRAISSCKYQYTRKHRLTAGPIAGIIHKSGRRQIPQQQQSDQYGESGIGQTRRATQKISCSCQVQVDTIYSSTLLSVFRFFEADWEYFNIMCSFKDRHFLFTNRTLPIF